MGRPKITKLFLFLAVIALASLFVLLTRVTTDASAPSAPADLTARAASPSEIDLTWAASTDNVGVTGYRIYRNGQQVATPTSTSYLDGGLSPDMRYSYSVVAFDATGNVSAQSPATSIATRSTPTVGPAYPLKMSSNHRYFVDQNNVPVFIVGDSPQSLSTLCTPTEQETYFSNRQSKGFNTVLIDLVGNSAAGPLDGKTYSGVAPFTSGTGPSNYDLAAPNETYFALMDTMLNLAASHGLNVFLDPIETIQWLVTLRNNGSTKAFNYGVYLGNRYKNFPNIIWWHGNDYFQTTSDNVLMGAVIDGIKSVDSNHLHTILPGGVPEDYSNLNTDLSSKFGADLTYSYSAPSNVTLLAYNSSPTLPVVFGEGNYEGENLRGFAAGTTGPYRLRATVYPSLSYGGVGGYMMGNQYTWRSTWMSDPSTRLNSTAQGQIAYINTLLTAAGAWWNLAPDSGHAVVTAGYGTRPPDAPTETDPVVTDYCTTSANSSMSLTYCPKQKTLTVAMTNFTGLVTARWYDPSNGTFTAISGSPFANTGTHNFAMPGNNADGNPDWLLLLQAAAGSPLISGHVAYADTVTPGKSVTMTLTAPSFTTQATTSDVNGNYTLAGVPEGNNYTVTPSKTGDVNGLESLDASDTARYVAGLALPSANQQIAGDADGDGILTSFDASLIARYVVGLPGAGIVGTWKFVPATRFYPALSGDQTSQNFTAILVGDAGGNWIPALPSGDTAGSSASFAGSSPPLAGLSPAVTVPVSLPNVSGAVGSSVSIPITVGNLTGLGVRAYDLQITFNPAVVQPQATPYDTSGTLSSGMFITPNATNPGHLIISAFQTTDMSGSGTLLKLRFNVVGAPGQSTALTFEDYPNHVEDYPNHDSFVHPGLRFNAGNPPASTTNGSLTVNGPTATDGNIGGTITDASGTPLSGAMINLSGTQSRAAITDANGKYSFASVETNGFYTVTPSRANYTFSPGQRSFSLLGGHTEASFTATANSSNLNPLDTTGFFVRQHYLDFLNREPDQSGFSFWTGEIENCIPKLQCTEIKHINVSAAFFLSIEFQGTGYLVERIYKAAYGDAIGTSTFGGTHQLSVPVVRFNEFLPDTQEIGQGVVVNRAGWEQALENSKQAFTAEFVLRSRFTAAFPTSMTAAQFVDTLNTNAGNPLSTSERNQLISDLSTGAKTRAQVLRAVAEDPDLNSAESNRAFVLMQYFGYLRRNPNDTQDTDYTGYDFWLTKLNQFNGNFVDAEMVKAFLSSGECRQRFR